MTGNSDASSYEGPRLPPDQVPSHWYNVIVDLAGYVPTEHRAARQMGVHSMRPQLPLSIYRQSVSSEAFIEIPADIRAHYERWRPTPLVRAHRLEQMLQTPARIYYKYEGASPSGSHKLNSAIAQAYYYKKAGVRELVTGTGAGQWGTALAMACTVYDMKCTVFMVRCSYNQKPQRRVMMELNGARVIPSPSPVTEAGKSILAGDPDCPGSLSVASSESHEYAAVGHMSAIRRAAATIIYCCTRRSSARKRWLSCRRSGTIRIPWSLRWVRAAISRYRHAFLPRFADHRPQDTLGGRRTEGLP